MQIKEVLAQVARKRNMTPKEVEEEIKGAIRQAMASQDPQAQMLWRQIAPDGKEPSVERFLEFCTNKLNEKRGY